MRIFFSGIVGIMGMVFMIQFLVISIVMANNSLRTQENIKTPSCHEGISSGLPYLDKNSQNNHTKKMICCDHNAIFSSSLISLSDPKKNNKIIKKDSNLQKFLERIYSDLDKRYYSFLQDKHHRLEIIAQKFFEKIFQKQEISGFLARKKIIVLLV